MRRLVTLGGALLLLAGARGALAAPLADVIAEVKRSIVAVGTVEPTRRPPGKYVGTGFVVGDGRTVVTNAHVVPRRMGDKEYLVVFTGDERGQIRRAKVTQTDENHDIALIRFEGGSLPALQLGDSGAVREGDSVAFTGFPIGMVLGFYPVTHRGIVAAITPIAVPQVSSQTLDPKMLRRLSDPYLVFQLDATAYPGNSGSPLYRPDTGRVIGLVNKVFVKESKEAVLEKPSGITYAIPATYIERLLDR